MPRLYGKKDLFGSIFWIWKKGEKSSLNLSEYNRTQWGSNREKKWKKTQKPDCNINEYPPPYSYVYFTLYLYIYYAHNVFVLFFK